MCPFIQVWKNIIRTKTKAAHRRVPRDLLLFALRGCAACRIQRMIMGNIFLVSTIPLLLLNLIIPCGLPVYFQICSKCPDPPSSPGSSRPASVRRSSTSWTFTCLARTPRAPRAFRPTGKISTNSRRMASPASLIQPPATTTPLPVWD